MIPYLMNDKLKKLAEQSGIKHRLDNPSEIWGYDKDLEKFAELIIRECFYISLLTHVERRVIKGHFGIN